MKIGVGYRKELSSWISSRRDRLHCLEITAEHFYTDDKCFLKSLAEDYRLIVHGLGLSLGTPGPLDQERLSKFAAVVRTSNPAWISEHVAFTRFGDVDLGHLNPVPPTKEMASILAEHAREVSEACGKPLILENITSHLAVRGEMAETDFLNRVCELSGCGLLLDVTNLYINSRNHQFDPIHWLQAIDAKRIRQVHIVGHGMDGPLHTDSHAEAIQPEVLDLAIAVLEQASVEAVILERDEQFPSSDAMDVELEKLENLRASR